MFEWSEEHAMVRDAVRQFVDNEIRPHRDELEFGDVPPYDVLRKMFQTFAPCPAAGSSRSGVEPNREPPRRRKK
jgi:alkylation response protein AidB-like acyl-CoA dehydrogenase